jgi:YNFM family putative membrane transporter
LALVFNRLLPASKNFHRQTDFHLAYHLDAFVAHLKNRKLDLLFLIGFLMMGTFVTIYNYLGFRLTAAPYHLSATQISFIFLTYIFGATSSPFAGSLADRIGRFPVILLGIGLTLGGVLLTLAQPLWLIVVGVILVTIGFFMTHSIASSWVGKLAKESKGHASSLYLLAYYLGSSILGSLGGWYWDRGQWLSVIDYTSVLLIGSLITALVVGRLSGVKVKAW